mmetsp:Transcript_4197/g.14689  ORF Transcript_4197/g.14689 Transcript_4197/m.14689 type:complete len:307 (-) Transcript_4197:362-1282(-)
MVHEEHERGWPHGRLRAVVDFPRLGAAARGRVPGRRLLDNLVEQCRGEPLLVLGQAALHGPYHLLPAAVLEGTSEDHLRPRDVSHALREGLLVVQHVLVFVLRKNVPLVHSDDAGATVLLALLRDPEVLLGGAHGRVQQQHCHVRLSDGAQRLLHRKPLDHVVRPLDARQLPKAGRVHKAVVPLADGDVRVHGVGRGTARVVDDHPVRPEDVVDHAALANVRPSHESNPCVLSLILTGTGTRGPLPGALALLQSLLHGLHELIDSSRGDCRHGVGLAETEPPEVGGQGVPNGGALALVDAEDDFLV